MSRSPFLEYFAEKIGKPLDAFTKQDWKDAAISAACFLELAMPKKGRPGRPRKRPRPGTLACLLAEQQTTKAPAPRGRPREKIGRTVPLTVTQFAALVEKIRSPEVQRKFADAPRTKKDAVLSAMRAIGHQVGYLPAVERALRRLKQKRT